MLTKLDWYIIKKFLGTFFFILGVIMLVAIIFDISEKIEDFVKNDLSLETIVFDYYVNFVLYYSNLFSSLLIFISVIFFTSKLASQTEIVAILSSGISFTRMLRPYFIVATLLTVISLYLNHTLIPVANKTRIEFENTYVYYQFRGSRMDIHKQINPGELVYFESYNVGRQVGYKFCFEKWEKGEMKMKLMADVIRYDSLSGNWKLDNYFVRKIEQTKESIRKGIRMDTTFNMSPKDFESRVDDVAMMRTGELNRFIEEEIKKGSDDIPYYLIEKHQRTSYPMAVYVLVLIGASIAGRKTRGGIGLHIAFGLLVCVVYILAMKVTTVYATNAGLEPFIAVWLPNFIFLFVAIWIYRKAPK